MHASFFCLFDIFQLQDVLEEAAAAEEVSVNSWQEDLKKSGALACFGCDAAAESGMLTVWHLVFT